MILVTMVAVIFTCRYFKLSCNTSTLIQSNCRNFSGSNIIIVISINLLVVYRESVNLIGYITRRLSADSLQL